MLQQSKFTEFSNTKKQKLICQKKVSLLKSVATQDTQNNKPITKRRNSRKKSQKSSRAKWNIQLIEQQEQKFRKNNIAKLISSNEKIFNSSKNSKGNKKRRLLNLKSLKLETDSLLNADDILTQEQFVFQQNLLNKILQSDAQDSQKESSKNRKQEIEKRTLESTFRRDLSESKKMFKRVPRFSSNVEEAQSKVRRHQTMGNQIENQQFGFLPQVRQLHRIFRNQQLLNQNFKDKKKTDIQKLAQNLKLCNIGIPLKLGLLGNKNKLTLNQSDKYYSGGKMQAVAKATKIINPKYCNFSKNSLHKEASKNLFENLPQNTEELKLQKSFQRNSNALKEISRIRNSCGPNIMADSLQISSKKHIGNSLKVLDLSNNKISDAIYTTEISKTIKNKMPFLQRLNLSQNYLTWKSSTQLNFLLHSNTIRHLNLRWNKLSAKGCKLLLAGSQHDIMLNFLDLSWNYLGNRYTKTKQQKEHRQNIQAQEQEHHCVECTQQIVNVINYHSNLYHFDISNNHFSKKESSKIVQAFNLHQSQNIIGFHFQGHFDYFMNCFGKLVQAENGNHSITVPIVQNYRQFQHPEFQRDQLNQKTQNQVIYQTQKDNRIVKQHRRIKSKSLMSSWDKNSLSPNHLVKDEYNSIKQTDKGLMQVRKFQQQVCWVCDKWIQKQFTFQLHERGVSETNQSKLCSVFVHFDFAGWVPLKMNENWKAVSNSSLKKVVINRKLKKQKTRHFKIKLMVPTQKEVQYFFSHNSCILLNEKIDIKRISRTVRFSFRGQKSQNEQGKQKANMHNQKDRIQYQAFIQYCNIFKCADQDNQTNFQRFLPHLLQINPFNTSINFISETKSQSSDTCNKWLFEEQELYHSERMSKTLAKFKLPKSIATIIFPRVRQQKNFEQQNNSVQINKQTLLGLYHHSSMVNYFNHQNQSSLHFQKQKSFIDERQSESEPQLLTEFQVLTKIIKKIQVLQDIVCFQIIQQHRNIENFQDDFIRQDSRQKQAIMQNAISNVSSFNMSNSSMPQNNFKTRSVPTNQLIKEPNHTNKITIKQNQIKNYIRISIDMGQIDFISKIVNFEDSAAIFDHSLSQVTKKVSQIFNTDKQSIQQSYLNDLPSISQKKSLLTAIQQNDYQAINDLIKNVKPTDKIYSKLQLRQKMISSIKENAHLFSDFTKFQILEELGQRSIQEIASIIKSILFELIVINLKLNSKVVKTIISKVVDQCSGVPVSYKIFFKILFQNLAKIFFVKCLQRKFEQSRKIDQSDQQSQRSRPVNISKQVFQSQSRIDRKQIQYCQLMEIMEKQQSQIKVIIRGQIIKIGQTFDKWLRCFVEKQSNQQNCQQ